MGIDDGLPALGGISWIDPRAERRMMTGAIILALATHVAFVFVPLPARQPHPPPPVDDRREPIWRTPIPPPPPTARQTIEHSPHDRRDYLAVPFAPDAEPIARVLEIEPEARSFEVLEGEIAAPPTSADAGGPKLPGGEGVSFPLLIPGSKISPEYPELARTARQEGRVIVQAVIHADGTVGEAEILQCTRPGVGFEEAAIAAITRWRYEPGRQNGIPIDVFLTIVVEFDLR